MPRVFDVAKYVLRKMDGCVEAQKLQKLCYYSQRFHAGSGHGALFPEQIEAWANGPVIPELYAEHRQQYLVRYDDIPGDERVVSNDPSSAMSVDHVISELGDQTGDQLSARTHVEPAWVLTRRGGEGERPLMPGERSRRAIPLELIVRDFTGEARP